MTLYCPNCAGTNLTPVYAVDGVTIRYYRCAPPPDGCNSIVRNPIVMPDAVKQNENA